MNTLRSSFFAVTIAFSLMVLNFSLAETEPPKTDQPKVATADPNVQKSDDQKQDGQPEENTETTKPKTAVDDKIKPWDPDNGNPNEYMERLPDGSGIYAVPKVYDENANYLGRLPFHQKDFDSDSNTSFYYNDKGEKVFSERWLPSHEAQILNANNEVVHTFQLGATPSSTGASDDYSGLISSRGGQFVQIDSRSNIVDAYIAPDALSQITPSTQGVLTVGFPGLQRWIIYKNGNYVTDVPFANKK